VGKSIQSIKAEIKREITRIHKDHFGKGPGFTNIHIVENIMIIKLKDFLSPLEESMLKLPDGKEKVNQIRKEIFKNSFKDYGSILFKLIKLKPLKIETIINFDSIEIYLIIIIDGIITKDVI
jgi:uncharacterized protein YbcI